MSTRFEVAPSLHISTWLNAPAPITLRDLRGRVVVMHAFQMLCPGCVMHSLPQMSKLCQVFADHEVVVLGIHTVFEHHQAMNVDALKVFAHEFRLTYPIGVDQASTDSEIPLTMAAYQLRGTPSLMVIDRGGLLRVNHFGQIDDMQLGGLIGRLLSEAPNTSDA
jgi:peroxiredoxin